ncbi:MAG TPA: hypothetical protein VFP71_05395 [Candidatus Angelobacter sp.]|nr:hypothetical protein [Candidatus Angelobacter sp.]
MAMAGLAVLLSIAACQSGRSTHREINGIRFRVPPGYKTRNSSFPGVFVFNQQEDNTSALIQVYFEHRASPEPGSDLTQEQIKSFGIRQTGKRKATLAGHDGACIEYSVSSLAQAECSFGSELHTSFIGTPSKIADFYAFMEAAQPMQRNN